MRGTAAQVMGALMALIGVALIVRTIAAKPDGLAVGLLLGVLFVAAGVGRVYVERRR